LQPNHPSAATHFARYPSLAGRVAFVSGGGGGIGASIVEHLCAQDARVAFVDIAEAASRELIERIPVARRPLFIPCDIRDVESLRAAIAVTIDKLGPITILINNAACDDRHPVAETTPAYWDDSMAVNLRHHFFAAQAVQPAMARAGGGSIVNLSSTSWMMGLGGMPAYVAAKAAIVGLTRGLAREFGVDRIRVNTVLPGWVMTERQLTKWMTPEGARKIDASQCLKQRLQPADVARLVLFLAADDSEMCTSQCFVVDGGWV
jgi:NAD(P)-dependent dehydrogenase (short-subunit alcohol dehydrogenase family)